MSKHTLTLVACARDENGNINEWLDYNFRIGVDRIYLYCNDDDPYPLYKTVLPYTTGPNPRLVFRHCPIPGAQKVMYRHFIDNFMGDEEWITFIDVDEFVTIRNAPSLPDFIRSMGDVDVIQLSWFNFGSNGHIYDPAGLKLPEYTRRNRYPHPEGKVIARVSSIDRQWTTSGISTFFHGFGDLSAKRKHQPFAERPLKTVTSWGADYYPIYERNFGSYGKLYVNEILDTAYISHLRMPSFEHLIRRVQRASRGDFLDQQRFRQIIENASFAQHDAEDSEVEDTWLRDHFSLPPVIEM